MRDWQGQQLQVCPEPAKPSWSPSDRTQRAYRGHSVLSHLMELFRGRLLQHTWDTASTIKQTPRSLGCGCPVPGKHPPPGFLSPPPDQAQVASWGDEG